MPSMDQKSSVDSVNECLYHLPDETEAQIEDLNDDDILFSSASTLTANTFIPKRPNELPPSIVHTIKSSKQSNLTVPINKSSDIMTTTFSCDLTCTQYLTCNLQNRQSTYKQHHLDKLDVVLRPAGVLNIECILLLNNLEDKLDLPPWFQVIVNKVMQKCRFKPKPCSNEGQGLYCYQVEKAFVTTPISYVLDKQAPHATLDSLEVVFNFTSPKSKEFQANWKRKLTFDMISNYLEEELTTLLIKKTFHLYPLIFDSMYAKKMTQSLPYLPHIAQSLQKIYVTSRSTMSVTNHAFSESIEQKLSMIQKNVDIMTPFRNDRPESTDNQLQAIAKNTSISDALTLGMYYSLRSDNKPTKNTSSTVDPPNALCSIAKLWSVTCSTSYNDDALI